MRFSNPSPRWFENGRLLGSAQTRSSRATAVEAWPLRQDVTMNASKTDAAMKAASRKRKHIKHSAFRGVFRQVCHRPRKTQRCGLIARIDFACNDGAGPSTNAGQHGDVLL